METPRSDRMPSDWLERPAATTRQSSGERTITLTRPTISRYRGSDRTVTRQTPTPQSGSGSSDAG